MDRYVLLTIWIGVGVLLLALMLWGWLRRRRRQSALAQPAGVPEQIGTVLGTFAGQYLATTSAENALDRIAVHGLGFRGQGALTVTDLGLLLTRAGERDLWIPREDLRDIRTATWTIDRSVEPGGLDLVEWVLGERTVDSYFRLSDARGFQAASAALVSTGRSTS